MDRGDRGGSVVELLVVLTVLTVLTLASLQQAGLAVRTALTAAEQGQARIGALVLERQALAERTGLSPVFDLPPGADPTVLAETPAVAAARSFVRTTDAVRTAVSAVQRAALPLAGVVLLGLLVRRVRTRLLLRRRRALLRRSSAWLPGVVGARCAAPHPAGTALLPVSAAP